MRHLFKNLFLGIIAILFAFAVISCGPTTKPDEPDDEITLEEKYHCVSLSEAETIAKLAGIVATTDKYNIYGEVVSVVDSVTGELIISDGEVEFLVKNITSGVVPEVSDKVVLSGNLRVVDETPQMVNATVLEKVENEEENPIKPSIKDLYDCITIEEALELAKNAGEAGTTESYYVYGIIKEVSNSLYGAMTIVDETGELYIYGTYSKDGETRYDAMEERPVKGDEVVLYGKLKTYKDEQEMDRGYIQAYHHEDVEIDTSEYKEMSIASAREAKKEEKVLLSGVVAQITYAFGQVPSGFYLVDNTGSIYVYGKEITGNVKVGNTVTIVGTKTYYVLADEQENAIKHGYTGCCQIENAQLVENDKGNTEFDKSWIEETTVKEIMNTSVTENITTSIYKVNALVKKAIGTGFTNYYIDDLDGYTGSYVYTQCSGSDFAWLDQFDGKICTVYLSPINAKASSSGCVFRFIPVAVSYDNFVFDQSKGAEFAIEYYAIDKFLPMYEADPTLEVVTSASNELINLGEVSISYKSSDENIGYFENVDGKVIFHTKNEGTVVITISAEYNGVEATREVVVEVVKPAEYETLTVKEAIETSDDTEVIVRGIVASSLVNQDGFYLIDETGIIAVTGNKADIALLSSGDEVVVKGIKDHKVKDTYTGAGQINIYNSEILVNYYGNHEYDTSNFITGKTVEDIYALDHNEDHSNEVYLVEIMIEFVETQYYTSLKVSSPTDSSVKLTVYCSGAGQYSFLKPFSGQKVLAEVAVCNWNSKTYYATCIMAVYTETGKVVNTLNFNE